ncbi:MAG: 3-deoxy-7-phosphoheptulonate synthase [Chloroflexi bacterium]|nr:MAG: 3-deoxy-7-phosphoheptulonate synthase [Chloroflexota bacterium]PIE82213.1 MAG: 3-deoxy-7-phosphoheptulonate synthase [Chloroflexota bacterium]
MIVVMKPAATEEHVQAIVGRVREEGCKTHVIVGADQTVIGVIGDGTAIDIRQIGRMIGVAEVVPISKPYKGASRQFKPEDTIIQVGDVTIGGNDLVVMAGPCSVEGRSELLTVAHACQEAGAHILRGGAYKPRSSPYSFQGLGEEGLRYLAEAREATGMPIVTEVMDPGLVPLVSDYADILQIGARNMQNYALLNAVGKSGKPVLLKRSFSGTIEEWLMSAEYILSHGNNNVMLCERGIRANETETRNTFDVSAIPVIKHLSHLPIIADPSHAAGKWEYVGSLSRASVAAGADGVILEVHPQPDQAWSDGRQSLKPARFARLVKEMRTLATAVGRNIPEGETAVSHANHYPLFPAKLNMPSAQTQV